MSEVSGSLDLTIYKTVPLSEAQNRTMVPLSDEDKETVNVIVSNFINYIKITHS
jgi:hypothetical protein